MKITEVEAVEVTVPIEAPLRFAYGVHLAFTRTLVKMHTDEGYVGLGETAASKEQVERLSRPILGQNPFDLEVIRNIISNRFYWSREPLTASALEMAAIDVIGKATGQPAYRLLGGALRPHIEMAAYCFYRYPSEDGTRPGVTTPEEMAEHAADLVERRGFRTVKLKGGVLPAADEVATMEALRERLGPDIRLRLDPQSAWTVETAVELAPRLERVGLEYYEDPVAGMASMATVRERTRLAMSTNMCVTSFQELGPAKQIGAIDVVLTDPWYWGGPTQVHTLDTVARTIGIGVSMHSGIELGIGMAVMAHTGVAMPGLTAAVDAHYHHLLDDVIAGDMLLPEKGVLQPPEGPGWGVELDEAKVAKYAELHASGTYRNVYVEGNTVGPDPYRPHWFPIIPAW
ncbi:enolase C-terminal domain-like protein [Phytoactinopolyspora halotolerans]|uniref:glucarate dehydratase n=1 Tax=Phytoactinopolyspora halotolerans TaxID=1981512 RepID=A0A6L9SHR2_9ACTN|nr:enolase C-terminal domain-like protein [Phytoactinopolyspora halotolerans]NEE04184.1 glucarate dehydratase [Phytoactinopolyspora halotolerans]